MLIRKSITFPKKLHGEIAEMAGQDNRSFTKQVIYLLEKSLRDSKKIKVIVITEDENAQKT